jgi:type IV pilus assembly protein PilY1
MATADFAPALDDVQSVETFVIGFFTDSDLLRDTATAQIENDDGTVTPGYFLANNVEDLRGAFNSILDGVGSSVATFTSPAVSVNSLNRLLNRDVLYFTMFRPASNGEPHWDGNLKAYTLGRPAGADPNVDNADLAILDDNGVRAINDDGIFRDSARSIWSANADGGTVTSGGFVSRLSANRRVVTNVAGADLFAADNEVVASNTQITAADLGLAVPPDPEGAAAVEARRMELLRFASGLEEDGMTPRRVIGDPLHTQPLIISYAGDADDLRLFFTTNDGYFHAIDPTPANASDDLEEFAFIPKELLPNLDTIERNPPALPNVSQKMYGLDGPLTSYIEGDTNFVVDPDERLYVYSAMRRGGTSYYALDLGAGGRSNPQLAFQIDRGDAGFAKLGQTWSAATPASVKIGGVQTDVLIFGGGYDTSHDTAYTTNDGAGNAIYMVNATSGALVWSASNSGATLNIDEMVYSIPSDVTVLDINQDGLADRMYVGDLGGQVWRFDIADSGITGARLAALGGADDADERRFFNAPRVARILTDDQNFLTIAIGSGWRSHPLATENQDRLYMLKDRNVFGPQVDATTGDIVYPEALTNDDLVAIELGTPPDAGALSGAGGWYLDLPNSGEKNLSTALLADNRVFFTTYAPTGSAVSCIPTPVSGVGRLYGLDILTGLPALMNTDGAGEGFIVLEAAGIPPGVQSVFVEPACEMNCDDPDPDDPDPPLPVTSTNNGTCSGVSEHTLMVGFQEIPVGVCTEPRRTYWSQSDEPLEDL